MVETTNDDQYTVMPLFLLALVSRGGLNTLYALQQRAVLQPGGVQPVLRKLEKEGLLQRSAEGKRRRRVMKVTKEGEARLAAHWQSCLNNHPDVESVLRAATIALMMDERRIASNYLLHMSADYEHRSGGAHATNPDARASPLDWYAYMRSHWETSRLQSAAQTMRNIGIAMEASAEAQPRAKLPPAKWLEGP